MSELTKEEFWEVLAEPIPQELYSTRQDFSISFAEKIIKARRSGWILNILVSPEAHITLLSDTLCFNAFVVGNDELYFSGSPITIDLKIKDMAVIEKTKGDKKEILYIRILDDE